MAGKAKILSSEQFDRVLAYVAQTSKVPFRDCVVLLLSFRAGLRVGEIAGLSWGDVTDAFCTLDSNVTVPNNIAKYGVGRVIPMHSELREALSMLHETLPPEYVRANEPVIRALRPKDSDFRTVPNSLQRYISRTYAAMGLRSFVTTLARTANAHGCSLRDVQNLAGHAYLNTTEIYVEPSEHVGKLIEAL
jgi:integrase/recombinase XerD